MNGSENNGWRERMDRAERAIQSLADTAAEHYARLAAQQEAHETRMAEHARRMAEIEARHATRLNDHEDAIFDVEAEHKRLLIAQVTMNETLNRITIRHEEGTE